jgi:hypothetical protein
MKCEKEGLPGPQQMGPRKSPERGAWGDQASLGERKDQDLAIRMPDGSQLETGRGRILSAGSGYEMQGEEKAPARRSPMTWRRRLIATGVN